MLRLGKWASIMVFVAFSLFIVVQSHALDPSSAVGVWLFDEGSGDVAADASGNGNDGALVGNPAWVTGKFGTALEFNGVDTCVETGKGLLNGITDFTIVVWVKAGNITDNRIGLVGQNDTVEFGLINPTTLEVWSEGGGAGFDQDWNFPADEWHHAAAVGTPDVLRLYIDGAGQEQALGTADHGTSDFGVNIGGCGVFDAEGNNFTGALDEVGVFLSALSDQDIADIMNNGLASALNLTSVEPAGKLATSWGELKAR